MTHMKSWCLGILFISLAWLHSACTGKPPAATPAPPPPPPVQQPVPQKAAFEESCAVCGMSVLEDSENRMETTLPTGKKVHFCSAICSASYLDKHPEGGEKLLVNDYQTHKMVPAATATYLYGSKLTVGGAMPPTAAAFADKTAAEKTRKESGGKILVWDSLVQELRKSGEFGGH